MSTESTNKPSVSKVIIERLHALDDLPHFPDALMKLERLLASGEDIHVDDIVQLIAQDPRLAAGLIGVVNTAKYWMGEKVTDLSDAVIRIGTQDVRMMAHAINYKSTFKSKPPFSEKHFLRHALLSAFVAQALGKALHVNTGEAFLSGLMHDIGIYLLSVEDRDKYLEVMRLTDYDITKLPAAENKVYGTNHALMSARLLQQWKFPQEIIMGVANHHTPAKAGDQFKPFAYITFLSEQAALRLGIDNGVADLPEEEHQAPSEALLGALKYFGLSVEEFDDLSRNAYETAEQAGML
ncbi:HDOD domain-containing protein [Thiomicrorhabdus sp. ZW0627]|uniref:HDOD domain-containing protein n=1 Tax=Thiomicrorhabdus sp. ZW0627 TaxID=3039774 RepID=UPI00243706E3|nr:HDOD domain-containing protein [Thiomicrorhabdus sp. ZW0627]MDG6774108.1 HDOD domain-containing protein [Thiomicrorhabdus sp. ZW0627]